MMQSVIDHGTGFTVRARGFTAPAAGKTGTSHDAWFAGYTSNLLCIVWVGYDDYSDLKLAGGATAAPIWAEFMKRAVHAAAVQQSGSVRLRRRRDHRLARQDYEPACHSELPGGLQLAFIEGSEPKQTCDGPDQRNIFQKIFGEAAPPPAPVNQPARIIPARPTHGVQHSARRLCTGRPREPQREKKRGFWGKLGGIFGGDQRDRGSDRPDDDSR